MGGRDPLPGFLHPEFAEWCDYVAREHCAGVKDDPKCCKRALRDARETLDTEALAAITAANAEAARWMRAAAEKG